MKKKIFALVFFGFLLGLIEACICSSAKTPYFDYHKLQVWESPFFNGTDTLQSFVVTPDSVEYLASVCHLTLTTAAYGTSCPEVGEKGPKHSMINFEVFADKDFNDTLKTGQSLSSLFYNPFKSDPTQNILQTLSEMEFFMPNYPAFIYTPHLPADTSQVFKLTLRITKSDGSLAEGEISGVKFK